MIEQGLVCVKFAAVNEKKERLGGFSHVHNLCTHMLTPAMWEMHWEPLCTNCSEGLRRKELDYLNLCVPVCVFCLVWCTEEYEIFQQFGTEVWKDPVITRIRSLTF